MDLCGRYTSNGKQPAHIAPEGTMNLIPGFERRGGLRFGSGEHIVVHALRGPREHPLVVLEPCEFGSAPLGEHGDVDGGMKPRRRRDGALSNGIHQTQRAKILENTRPSGPGNLTILRSPQRFKYSFVGIRCHLTSFLKCSHDTSMPTRHRATGHACGTRLSGPRLGLGRLADFRQVLPGLVFGTPVRTAC